LSSNDVATEQSLFYIITWTIIFIILYYNGILTKHWWKTYRNAIELYAFIVSTIKKTMGKCVCVSMDGRHDHYCLMDASIWCHLKFGYSFVVYIPYRYTTLFGIPIGILKKTYKTSCLKKSPCFSDLVLSAVESIIILKHWLI